MVQPYVNHIEGDSVSEKDNAPYIPIFIGRTGISASDDDKINPTFTIKTFNSYNDACVTTSAGGLGVEPANLDTNPLLKIVKDYYTEGEGTVNSDVAVGLAYAIDLGNSPTAADYIRASELAQTQLDARVEVYTTLDVPTMKAVWKNIMKVNIKGYMKYAYFIDIEGKTDAELMALTTYIPNPTAAQKDTFINKSRINIIEKPFAGKHIAKICYTSFDIEPALEPFRTVEVGEFKKRTQTEMDALSDAGIIFGFDDYFGEEPTPCMNLATSTAWSLNDNLRPHDSLNHARRIADKIIIDVQRVAHEQLKRNETSTNIAHVQSDCDQLVDEGIQAGYLMSGSKVTVKEDDGDPYTIIIHSKLRPVNSTLYIEHHSQVLYPNVKVTDVENYYEEA